MSYTLYISSLSPYSIKAAALLGYAGVPCRVQLENVVNRYAVLKRLTGKTMVPVLRRGNWALNDSTRIARWAIEQSDRSLLPEESALQPVAWLLEEFADEWVTRWMVFSRWCNDPDRRAASRAIGEEMTAGVPLVHRPMGRLSGELVRSQLARGGARESNRAALEQSRDRILQALERIFESTDGFLFGGEPTVADFALYGQIEQYRRDPTGGKRMEMYPAIGEWLDAIDRMRVPHPVVAIRHESDVDLERLQPLFGELFGAYWRVAVAVHRARSARAPGQNGSVRVELLDGTRFECEPSKYMAGRVEFILTQLDRLVGVEGGTDVLERLGIAEAIDDAVGRLASDPSSESLLERFDELSANVS